MTQPIDYFLSQLFQPSGDALFSVADVFMAMSVSALLCFVLSHVYRLTHRGVSYSQSFLVTMFIMGVATSIVMMIIGSNIARAFSLVGALSIIRFRTAVKDARDTGFLFAAMISGMGCGTKFYMPAISLVAFLSVLLLLLYHFDYGIKKKLESVLRVTLKESPQAAGALEEALSRAFAEHKLINRVLDFGDGHVTNVYVVRPARQASSAEIESRLAGVEGVVRLAFYETEPHAPF